MPGLEMIENVFSGKWTFFFSLSSVLELVAFNYIYLSVLVITSKILNDKFISSGL